MYFLFYNILWSLCVDERETRYDCEHQSDTLLILKCYDDCIYYYWISGLYPSSSFGNIILFSN
jgi:hypothetical protein